MAEDTKAKKGGKKRSTYKTRNWVTVLYPESMKPNWRDIVRGWCVQAFASPIHDRDMNPDETPKKPHIHLMTMWDGPKSAENVEKLFAELGAVGAQPCNSARGYARYLCHLDNPEKAQYDMGAVEAFGGADYLEVIALESDRRQTIAEMQEWCDTTGCISFKELCTYARKNNPVWWQALTAHSTMIMYRYLRSAEYDAKEAEKAVREAYTEQLEDAALRWGKMSDEERVDALRERMEKDKAQMERLQALIAAKAGEGDKSPYLGGEDAEERKEGGDRG